MKILPLIIIVICLLSSPLTVINAQKMTEQKKTKVAVKYLTADFPISELDNQSWETAHEIDVQNYWSGKLALIGRHFKARLLWSNNAFYIRFEANQTEPLVISKTPNLEHAAENLWNRDVCEIFIAPDKSEFRRYFEFEVAPNGEWVDLAIHQRPDNRETNLEYHSGMKTAAKIEKDKVWMAIKIEWPAFKKTPKPGDIWLGNIFRCIGSGATRGYLAWQATKTKKPNFHVPTVFGEFEFVK